MTNAPEYKQEKSCPSIWRVPPNINKRRAVPVYDECPRIYTREELCQYLTNVPEYKQEKNVWIKQGMVTNIWQDILKAVHTREGHSPDTTNYSLMSLNAAFHQTLCVTLTLEVLTRVLTRVLHATRRLCRLNTCGNLLLKSVYTEKCIYGRQTEPDTVVFIAVDLTFS